jgi:hypothetical protein
LSAGSGDLSAGDLLSGAGGLSAGLHSASVLPNSQSPLVSCTVVRAVKFEQLLLKSRRPPWKIHGGRFCLVAAVAGGGMR